MNWGKSIIILTLLLAGCGGTTQVVPQLQVETPNIPSILLHCAAAPAVPDAKTQRVVAEYVLDLWSAGQDCRDRLNHVRAILQADGAGVS